MSTEFLRRPLNWFQWLLLIAEYGIQSLILDLVLVFFTRLIIIFKSQRANGDILVAYFKRFFMFYYFYFYPVLTYVIINLKMSKDNHNTTKFILFIWCYIIILIKEKIGIKIRLKCYVFIFLKFCCWVTTLKLSI